MIPFAIDIAKVLTIVLGVVMILGNVFEVNVTALVTGLGIGGVAFALASKESLENLLGSFTIFFDKPFTVGDIVTLGGVTGIVEKVGFRSTRIRTFDKSVVTVPNKNIISTELDCNIEKNWKLDEIKTIEGLLFISMLPLHSDNVERQLAFFCVGIERLNEIFGI